ncbi:MAG: hypothetical protein EPN23_05095, partial [Verrucomicrobia bacterium]
MLTIPGEDVLLVFDNIFAVWRKDTGLGGVGEKRNDKMIPKHHAGWFSKNSSTLCLALMAAWLLPPRAQAASDSWNVDAAGTWITAGNWLGGNVPGNAAGVGNSNSTDVATFSLGLTANRTVTVDANRNIGGLTFGNVSNVAANGYTLSGGSFLLSDGGVIQVLGTSGTNATTISTPITIMGNSGSATIRNDWNGNQGATLSISGSITGNATVGNTTTLNLDGVSAADAAAFQNRVTGSLSDGSLGGKLKVVKNGTGEWSPDGLFGSTFTGGFVLNAGTVRFSLGGTNGFGAGAVTINGGTFKHSGGGAMTVTNNLVIGGNFSIGTLGSDGLSWSGAVDLGSATRTITVTQPALFSGVVSGAGGLTKAGVTNLTLSGANTYSGDTTISLGTLRVANALALQNSTLRYSAGTFVFSSNSTAYALGGLAGSSNIALTNDGGATISLTVGGNTSNTTYSGVLSQGGSLIKTGTGMLTLSGANTYSGGTTVSNGVLQLGVDNALPTTTTLYVDSVGTVDLNGKNQTLAGLDGSKGAITNAGNLTLNFTAATNTF